MFEKADKIKSRDNYVSQRMQAIENNMLGNYNKDGEYVVNERIVSELVALKKVCKDSAKGELYCTAKTKTGKLFNFQIRMNTYPLKNMSVAKLYLLEDIQRLGGKQTKTIKTKIAKFTDDIADDFFEKAIDYFNVTIDEDDKGQEVKETIEQVDTANIEFRQTMLGYVGRNTADKFDDIYERMFNDKFYYLRRSNSPFARQVLGIFFDEINDGSGYYYKDIKNKIPNYRAMYDLLTDKISEIEMENKYNNDKHYKDFINYEKHFADNECYAFNSYMNNGYNLFHDCNDFVLGLDNVFDNIGKHFDNAIDNAREFFNDLGDSIEYGWDKFTDSVGECWDKVKGGVRDFGKFFDRGFDKIKDALGFGGNDKQVIKEANGLYIDKYVEKYTQIDQKYEYSNNIKEKYSNLYNNKENDLVNKFGAYDKERDAEALRQKITQNNNNFNNLKIKTAPFQDNNINQKFELNQHKQYENQTNLTLSNRVAQINGQQMMKKFGNN